MLARRKFLQSMALGSTVLAGPWLTEVGGALPGPDALSLGFSLYGMKSLPLDQALRVCAEIGYSHVEFSLNAGYPTEPALFGADARRAASVQLQALKLELPCLMVLMNLTADEATHAKSLELIGVAGSLGKELVNENPPILETVLGGQPAKWESQKFGMLSQLQDWAAVAEKAGTVIAIKAHVGSAVNSPERLLWLLEEVKSPAIRAAYDFSHFELQGIDLEESLRLLLPRTKFIHVKDSQGDAGKFRFLLPGEGRTDYVRYFSLLQSLGYAGPVCVEVSGQVFSQPGYDAITAAKSCWTVLSGALQKARG